MTEDELRQLAGRFSEGWHEGIKIDASDIMLLCDAANELELLRKDAERYRHIRIHCASIGMCGREWLWDQPDAEAALDRFVDEQNGPRRDSQGNEA